VTCGAVKGAAEGQRSSWPLTAAFILTLDSPASHFTIEPGTKRNAVQLSFVPSWSGFRSLFFLGPSSWACTLRLTALAFSIIIVSFRSQNILDLLRTKSSGKLWPTPPHRCHASIRTLNGPLKDPVQVGFDLIPGPSLP
jgi:hypothetical protein